MKVILILLLLPICLFSQKKGDNTIVIQKDVSISDIKGVLFKNGYAIATSDSLFISTSEKELTKNFVVLRILIARMDSATYVKAHYKSTISAPLFGATTENQFEVLKYGGMKGSQLKEAWNELDKVAKMINQDVTYIKQ